jgi:type I restriction enzyme M protein
VNEHRAFSSQNIKRKEEILEKECNLSIPRYVHPNGTGNKNGTGDGRNLKKAWVAYEASGREFWMQMDELMEMLDDVVPGEAEDA